MNKNRDAAGRHLAILLSCVALVCLAIAFLDRPASTWSHAALHEYAAFDWPTHIVDPLLPAATTGLLLAGAAAAVGRCRPGEHGMTLIACCLSIVVAVAIKEQFKSAFGRTWPETWIANNPSWIGTGAYGFNFFHGGEGWASFPSGHMTQISALAGVLCNRVRRLRMLWVALVLLVAIGLFGANYHFIGDIVAGTYLGFACAAGVLALLKYAGSMGNGMDRASGS